MQVVENIALISINATLFVQLGSFLLFMVIFNRIMVRPLRNMMAERNAHVRKIVDEIHEADTALDNITRQIENQENEVRTTAFKIQRRIEGEGQHKADDIVAKAREEIARMRQTAQKENAVKIAATRQQIESEAGPVADHMIAVLLGRRSAS
jgi:F-type H+-transporting ATPase subunit b